MPTRIRKHMHFSSLFLPRRSSAQPHQPPQPHQPQPLPSASTKRLYQTKGGQGGPGGFREAEGRAMVGRPPGVGTAHQHLGSPCAPCRPWRWRAAPPPGACPPSFVLLFSCFLSALSALCLQLFLTPPSRPQPLRRGKTPALLGVHLRHEDVQAPPRHPPSWTGRPLQRLTTAVA